MLYLFYTDPGESTSASREIKFGVSPEISTTGQGTFAFGSWSIDLSVSEGETPSYTNHKIDGFYDFAEDLLVIVYQDVSSGEIFQAISDDHGDTWNITDLGQLISGAPSIVFDVDP